MIESTCDGCGHDEADHEEAYENRLRRCNLFPGERHRGCDCEDFKPAPKYDPATCITAGELRSMGMKIPDTVPDCGWIPRFGIKMENHKTVADGDTILPRLGISRCRGSCAAATGGSASTRSPVSTSSTRA